MGYLKFEKKTKALIVSIISLTVGALPAHQLTVMKKHSSHTIHKAIITMDAHSRLTRSEYEFMTKRSKNHLDMRIVEGIAFLKSNLVYEQTRKVLLAMLDRSVAYRYP